MCNIQGKVLKGGTAVKDAHAKVKTENPDNIFLKLVKVGKVLLKRQIVSYSATQV